MSNLNYQEYVLKLQSDAVQRQNLHPAAYGV